MIQNPILPGFNADPCICRKGDDFFLAVSSFEWFPCIPIYHSRDLKHWELYSHVITDECQADLRGLPSAKGVWAPCLTYCEAEDTFYAVYGIMHSMNARYFDVDNYLVSAKDPRGPWSTPVYLHSSGFDASLFHDDDGRKYVVALDWETRDGYCKPGDICMAEYDPKKGHIMGTPRRIWHGATQRGCMEGPHLTKHNGMYYLMCAEGGTGYGHCVTMARSGNPWGPYQADPNGVLLTSQPEDFDAHLETDHLKPRFYNPLLLLQKAGHGSYVDTPSGETYMVFHCSRPMRPILAEQPSLRCALGRETAIVRMRWTTDGWLRTVNGSILAPEQTEESNLPPFAPAQLPACDDFADRRLGIGYYAPRIDAAEFADTVTRPGWVCLRGQESFCSQNRVSLLARKLTSLRTTVTTRLDFHPEVYQQTAGLLVYYDNMNWLLLGKTWSDGLNAPALVITHVENGMKRDCLGEGVRVGDEPIHLRIVIQDNEIRLFWCQDGKAFAPIGSTFETSRFSDEYSRFGEFTGTFIGIGCEDRMLKKKCAYFDFLAIESDN
jgi:xylan 1,4-beta-xylosidase